MLEFDPNRLRTHRLLKGFTAVEVASRLGISPAQINRLEKGNRRLTVDNLIAYCSAIGVSVGQLFAPNVWVPVTGAIDSDFEIQPLAPSSPNKILAPPLMDDMDRVAAVCWAASRRFAPMAGHAVFFDRHESGVPEIAWNKRCVVVRKDGSQCLGWPVQQQGNVHIDVADGPAEFNVDIGWASPVIAVMPPHAIASLQPPA